MAEKAVKYEIKGLFDRKETAREFGMTLEEMMSFHNQHCKPLERLTKTLPFYVPHIYIPEKNYQARQDELLKYTTINLPKTKNRSIYGVKIQYTPSDISLHYQIKINRDAADIELRKEQNFINNEEVQKVVEGLMETVEKSLYPLVLRLNGNGTIKNITNADYLLEKWKKETLPSIREYYQSKVIDEKINAIDQAFSRISQYPEGLTRSVFYRLFFLPVYRNYPHYKSGMTLPVYFSKLKKEVRYRVEMELEREYTRSGKISLRLKGEEEESVFNKAASKGKLNLWYKLDPATHEIFSITGFLTSFWQGEEYKMDFGLFKQKFHSIFE